MTGLENIPEQKTLLLLETYQGANNYILKLKDKFLRNPKFYPTRSQADYVITNYDVVPKVAKKWVELDSYFAKKFAEDKLFMETPSKIYVEKLLVERDTSYHIWGKFFDNEELTDIWVPKASIIKTNNKEVSVDYEKYSHRPPKDHQKIAIELLLQNDKYILADDMGVGKTTSAAIASIESNSKKILIICPATLKINWEREIKLYSDRTTAIVEGKVWKDADYVIVNYDILKNFHDLDNPEKSIILNGGFDLCIIDEAHYISNSQAARTKITNGIVDKIRRVWLLTGTPITSRPINYYSLLRMINCPIADNWMAYVIRYCSGYQFKVKNRKIWNVTGASNLDELRERTSKYILRRLKEDVLDLPDKIITPIYLRLKSKEYEDLMGEYFDWYDKKNKESSLAVQFSKLVKVRQLIANEKVDHTIDFCENIIEQGKKVIIFCNFTESLDRIYNHFGKKAVKLDGSMSKTLKQESVDRFQTDDKVMVFVGNIKAAGVGITLTAAEVVVMNDLSFVPSDHSQAEDRAYRYGQKSNVLVYYPLFENTIEGQIYDILNKKKQIIGTVMGDNVDEIDLTDDILSTILSNR